MDALHSSVDMHLVFTQGPFFGAKVQLCFLSTIYDDNRHFIVFSVNAGC